MDIELTAQEWARARHFGNKRHTYQKQVRGIKDAAKYDGMNFKVTGADQDTLGVACEYAVIRYLGLDPNNCGWCTFSTDPALYKAPDILGVIDVRRVTEPGYPLRAETKDVRDNAILVKAYVPNVEVVNGEMTHSTTVQLLGWEYATVIQAKGQKTPGGTWGRYSIQPMHTLEAQVGVAA